MKSGFKCKNKDINKAYILLHHSSLSLRFKPPYYHWRDRTSWAWAMSAKWL